MNCNYKPARYRLFRISSFGCVMTYEQTFYIYIMNRNILPTIDPFAGDYIEGGLTFEQAADSVLVAGCTEGWHRQKEENSNQQKPIATAITTTDSADVDRGSRRHHSLFPYHKIAGMRGKVFFCFSVSCVMSSILIYFVWNQLRIINF